MVLRAVSLKYTSQSGLESLDKPCPKKKLAQYLGDHPDSIQ